MGKDREKEYFKLREIPPDTGESGMRTKERQWKNAVYPNWNCRIEWFAGGFDEQAGEDTDIKLKILDSTREVNIYPRNEEHAEKIYKMFQKLARNEGLAQAGRVISTLWPYLYNDGGKWEFRDPND